jgi:hypothetical protein
MNRSNVTLHQNQFKSEVGESKRIKRTRVELFSYLQPTPDQRNRALLSQRTLMPPRRLIDGWSSCPFVLQNCSQTQRLNEVAKSTNEMSECVFFYSFVRSFVRRTCLRHHNRGERGERAILCFVFVRCASTSLSQLMKNNWSVFLKSLCRYT